MVAYHDSEWGTPSRDPVHLFELVTLEGAQSGLSWSTVLAKRAGYRRLFADFDAEKVAAFTPADVDRILLDPGVIRHRGKVESVLANAQAILALDRPLEDLLWTAVAGVVVDGNRQSTAELPGSTPASAALAKTLQKKGFRFVGPTTCYSLMQASGMVDDHLVSCFRHRA